MYIYILFFNIKLFIKINFSPLFCFRHTCKKTNVSPKKKKKTCTSESMEFQSRKLRKIGIEENSEIEMKMLEKNSRRLSARC